jgi:hypothetical protein
MTKGLIPAVIAAAFGVWFLAAFANSAREATLQHLLERGYPTLAADESVQIRRIEWPDHAIFTFAEFDGNPQVLTVGGWEIHFSTQPLNASFDAACGFDCDRALRISGMSCATPALVPSMSTRVACTLHAWTVDGRPSCFFSMEGELPATEVAGIRTTLPSEVYFECPASLGWVAQ